MEKGYKILGNYIRLVDERNKNLAVTKLLGVSISKKFIPSIANIVGTDLSNYKIVRTGQFSQDGRQSGNEANSSPETRWRPLEPFINCNAKVTNFAFLIRK